MKFAHQMTFSLACGPVLSSAFPIPALMLEAAARESRHMFRVTNDARFWDRAARKYAAGPIADIAGYERTLERTRHYLKGNEAAFEFGCGTGTTALRLAPSVGRIVATDLSSEMIAIARDKAKAEGCSNATFEVTRPEAAPWPDETFDVAFGFNVLHWWRSAKQRRGASIGCCGPAGSSFPRRRA
jgi:SAM-dependent methyltransferase